MQTKKTLHVYWLDSEQARIIKQMWREVGKPLGNDYYYIAYKNGGIVVYDRSYDEDSLPSLNLNNVLYVSTWFSPDAEVFINPKLSHEQVEEIIRGELYDEDGNIYYQYIEFARNFPYWEYENI